LILSRLRKLGIASTTPEVMRPSDLFLVAYPKSGVTWLSFLIANLALRLSEDRRRVTFFNLQQFVSDIHVSNKIGDSILPSPGCRIIKSHATYNKDYKILFYLVRDPRNVMVSYFKFLRGLNAYSGNIHEFVRDERKGISAWVAHVESWVHSLPISTSAQFFRYEDLRNDTSSVLKRIMILWGYEVDDALINKVIQQSSFEIMKGDEAFYTEGNPTVPSDFAFVRKGSVIVEKNELSEDDISYIENKASDILRLLKYA